MILFSLRYGQGMVEFSLPENRVIRPRANLEPPPVAVSPEQLERTITQSALSRIENGSVKTVCLICDDYTRPTPAYEILPPLRRALAARGVRRGVKMLVAAGDHRPMSRAEQVAKFGPAAVDELEIVHHDCRNDAQLVCLGDTTGGVPVWVNRLALDADFRIGIGVVEIHPWAGFSGGCKILMPGIAGKRTIDATHALSIDPRSDLGRTDDNPFWLASREVAEMANLDLVVNVVLRSSDEAVIGAFCDTPVEAQRAAIAHFRASNELVFDRPADIVITSASPKYHYWPQAAISAYAAARVVRDGGVRIVLADCPEGLGDCEEEREFYREALDTRWESLDAFWRTRRGKADCCSRTACAVYRHLELQRKSRCIMVSRGLPKDGLRNQEVVRTLDEALDRAHRAVGEDAAVAVIREGGMVLPSLGKTDEG
ncbi:MAG: nickel-dependent lactate racemase [Planctomycetota bacterium]